MCSVTLNFADWLEAIFWRSFWHIFWHSFWQIFWYNFWHSFWHIFWHSFWHLSDISFDILSDKSFDTLSDISSDILSDISFDMLSDISSDILSDISKPKPNIHSFTQKAALQTLYLPHTTQQKSYPWQHCACKCHRPQCIGPPRQKAVKSKDAKRL